MPFAEHVFRCGHRLLKRVHQREISIGDNYTRRGELCSSVLKLHKYPALVALTLLLQESHGNNEGCVDAGDPNNVAKWHVVTVCLVGAVNE